MSICKKKIKTHKIKIIMIKERETEKRGAE
jgi:hypothetical protein